MSLHLPASSLKLLPSAFCWLCPSRAPHQGCSCSELCHLTAGISFPHEPGLSVPCWQVIVLSTRLLKPLSIPELLFATDRLHPDLGF